MIQLQLKNVDSLWLELDKKISGIKEITSVQSRNEIARAIFTITSKKFLKDFALESARFPKKYHHVFEWGAVGDNQQKLFTVKRGNISSGNLAVKFVFEKSQKNVPVPSALLRPNRNGKRVTRRSVFVNKAEVMESGREARFRTRGWIVFLSEGTTGKKVFRGPGTNITIKNPGGRQTAGSFNKYITSWYASKAESAVRSSGLFKNIGKEVSLVLNKKNGGPIQARAAIQKVARAYAEGRDEL